MAGKRIEFQFAGDASDLEAALRSIQREGREAGDEVKDGGVRGAAGLSKAEKASKALKASLVAVGAAAAATAAATAAVVRAASDLAARGDQVAKMAKTLNMSAEGLQVIQGALELGGVAAQSTANALHKLNINLGEAAEGTGPAADALEKLGLTFEQIEALAPEERIALIADALGGFESETIRASLAQDLLGRGAKEMLAAFTDGGDAIRANMELIRQTGIISNETAAQSEALVDAQTLLTRRMGKLRDDALAPLLPVLTDLADELRGVMDETDPKSITKLGETFSRIILDVMMPAAIFFGREFAKVMISTEVYVASLNVAFIAVRETIMSIPRTLHAAFLTVKGEHDKAFKVLFKGARDMERALDDFDVAAGNIGTTLADIDATADKLAAAVARVSRQVGAVQKEASSAKGAIEGVEGAIDGVARAADEGKFSLGEMLDGLIEDINETQLKLSSANLFDDLFDEDALGEVLEVDVEPRLSIEQQKALKAEAISAAEQVASATTDIMKQAADQILEDRVAAARETADRIADLDEKIKNATTESEKERLIEQRKIMQKRQANQKAEALEAWHISQALAVSQAIINTAAGVAAQLVAGPPTGFIMAGIAAAMGAAQVAAIAAEPPPQFHAGGMIGSQARVHDEINIRARAGEAVLSPQGVAAAGGPGGVNALNAGGSASGPNVTVFQVGHRVVDSMVHESLRRPGGRLTRELRAVRPRRIGRYNPHRS